MSLEMKKISFRPQNISDQGDFFGYASVFNVLDHDKDIVVPGAFAKSLENWKRRRETPLLLWQHNVKEPVGYCHSLKEDPRGLFVAGRLLAKLRRGREAFHLVKSGFLKSLSIGFIPRSISKKKFCKNSSHGVLKVRYLREIDLKEISLVKFPANPAANIVAFREKNG